MMTRERNVVSETGSLLSAYLDHQRARGLSTSTSRRRSVSIGRFRGHIAPCALEEATTELVEDFLATIPVATTRRAYRSDLNALYSFAVKRRLVPTNPVAFTDTIRVPRAMPRPVPAELVRTLIELAPDRETELAIALAAYAGLRRFEVANLTRDDVVLGGEIPMIYVRMGKGAKDRAVPVHPDLEPLLRRLPAGRVVALSAAQIGVKVSTFMRELGVDATMHQLRHSFATEGAKSGDLVALMNLLGHESLSTTSRYTALTGNRTVHVVRAMYPAAS